MTNVSPIMVGPDMARPLPRSPFRYRRFKAMLLGTTSLLAIENAISRGQGSAWERSR